MVALAAGSSSRSTEISYQTKITTVMLGGGTLDKHTVRLVASGPFKKPTDASGDTLQARQSRSTIVAHWAAAVFAWVNFSAHALAR